MMRLLRAPVPSPDDDVRAFMTYVHAAHTALAPYARGDVVLENDDAVELARARCAELTTYVLNDEPLLRAHGLTDTLHSLFTTTLVTAWTARAAVARAAPVAAPPWLRDYIERAELCRWPPTTRDPADVRDWPALRAAIETLSAAVTSLRVVGDARGSARTYAAALETRAALFVADGHFDDEVLRVAYLLIGARRVIEWAVEATSPAFYEFTLGAERRSARRIVRATPAAAAVEAFLRAEAATCVDVEREDFGRVAATYFLGAGEAHAHTRFFGIGGVERPSVVDVLERRLPPDAIDYWRFELFEQPMTAWFDARANPVRGGALTLRVVEDMAVLYVLKRHVAAVENIDWPRYFLVTHERAELAYLEHVTRGIVGELPFILQTAGEWTCFAPRHDDAPAAGAAERVLGLEPDTTTRGHRMYVCADVFIALAVWATLIERVHRGALPSTPGVTLLPLVRRMCAATGPSLPDAPSP